MEGARLDLECITRLSQLYENMSCIDYYLLIYHPNLINNRPICEPLSHRVSQVYP